MKSQNFNDVKVRVIFDRRGVASRTQTGTVEIEIAGPLGRRRISSGVKIYSHQWSVGRVVRHPDAPELNRIIEDKVVAARLAVANGDTEAEAVVPRRLAALAPLDWITREMEARQIAPATRRHHESLLNELRASGMFNHWRDFTPRTLALWDARLRNVRGLTNQTTIYDYHKRLRAYLRRAVILDLLKADPYEKFKVAKGKAEATMRFLLDSEREQIEALELPEGTGAAIARDMFLLSCYTGLAYGDMVKIKPSDFVRDGDRVLLIDKRNKSGTQYRLTILPQALDILNKYGYDMNRLTNQKANAYLKGIGAVINLKHPLTMHCRRHYELSFSLRTNGLQRFVA